MTADAKSSPDPAARSAVPPPDSGHRQRPSSPAFRAFIAEGWADRPADRPHPLPATRWTPARRAAISARFPGERLVVPAGVLRVRSNDTDYRFRPHSAFAHLTGLGTDREPDAVLVLEPRRGDRAAGDGGRGDGGHDAVLYYRPRAERDTEEFYASARYGELWVGARRSLAELTAETELETRHLDEVIDAITKDVGGGEGEVAVRVVRESDPAVDVAVDAARAAAGLDAEAAVSADRELLQVLSELRLVKDAYEIEQLRRAVEVTARGFADIVRELPRAVGHPRGERVVERAFESRARQEGNGVGYDTIAAAGPHACTLHWIRNDGPVREGDLVLVDAGVEVDSLYTADVTRTLPVSGRFTPAQREVYEAVLEAADAAFALARPGTTFRELHEAAMQVIARRIGEWGLLPGTVEETLGDQGQFHRRWMIHGTSHHLGIDVHDCAQARREMYLDAELRPGMVFTIEPGLYFLPDDLKAPEAFRGIGVRIEDDVMVTDEGCENLSAALPRTVPEIEAWMAGLRG
ncbi:MAG TPA: aminopeptidase P family protein [Kineosporiaceae bacterium]